MILVTNQGTEIVRQSSTEAPKAFPELSDIIKSVRQAAPEPETFNTTSTPWPAEIVAPAKLNPRTMLLPVFTGKSSGFCSSTTGTCDTYTRHSKLKTGYRCTKAVQHPYTSEGW